MLRHTRWSAIFRIFMRPGHALLRDSGVHVAAGRPAALAPAHRVDLPLCWTVTRLHADALNQLTQAVCTAAGAVLAR